MRVKLKRLSEQVMVITGATSGIGLVTAREAAARGARLVLAARSERALGKLVKELEDKGCEAIDVVADVGNEDDVNRIADRAIAHFGGFDTWLNNSGVSIYGPMDAPSAAEYRRLFDTNFWGVVFGALTARKHLRQKCGAIITVGSAASEFAIPVQGMYSASKHAVKGFIDAFRLETRHARAPIAVTLIKPASVNTQLPDHAVNYMSHEPRLPPPVYAPETVANAILHAAEHPTRELFVGGPGRIVAVAQHHMPRLADLLINTFARDWLTKDERDTRTNTGILFEPSETLRERHGKQGFTFEASPYTRIMLARTKYASLGAVVAAFGLTYYLRQGRRR